MITMRNLERYGEVALQLLLILMSICHILDVLLFISLTGIVQATLLPQNFYKSLRMELTA